MSDNVENKRQSNIELMRIICMLLIVAHHYVVHGGTAGIDYISEKNSIMLYAVAMWPRVAINCFVLTTGYFGCQLSDKKVMTHLKKMWLDRWLYSIGTLCFALFYGDITTTDILQSIFPTLFSKHNYVTSFIVLYIFIPYINEAIKNFTLKSYRRLLLCASIFFSFIPTCIEWTNEHFDRIYTDNTYSYVLWMIFVYLLGAYIKIYGMNLNWRKVTPIMLIGMLFIGIYIEKIYAIVPSGYFTNTQNSFIVLIVSICVFKFFLELDISYSKAINILAASSFAVLLIHDDPLIRKIFWNKVSSYVNEELLFVHLFFSVSLIYVMCILIDKVYVFVKKKIINIFKKVKGA